MTDKQAVIDALNRLPENVSLEEITEELRIMAAIRRGREDIAAGRSKTQSEAESLLESWAASELARHLSAQVQGQKQAQTTPTKHDDEEVRRRRLDWLKAHREEYAGQYVALDGDVLVGHGATIGEAHEQAKRKGVQSPFLVRLTSEKEILFGGW